MPRCHARAHRAVVHCTQVQQQALSGNVSCDHDRAGIARGKFSQRGAVRLCGQFPESNRCSDHLITRVIATVLVHPHASHRNRPQERELVRADGVSQSLRATHEGHAQLCTGALCFIGQREAPCVELKVPILAGAHDLCLLPAEVGLAFARHWIEQRHHRRRHDVVDQFWNSCTLQREAVGK